MYSKVRISVQKTMEDLKQNSAVTNGNIQRYFKEMRDVVDEMEGNMLIESQTIFNGKLKRLKEQCRYGTLYVIVLNRYSCNSQQRFGLLFFQMERDFNSSDWEKTKFSNKVLLWLNFTQQYLVQCFSCC